MLHEISVENLGVVAELHLVMGAGMTAVTGETGAGKTLIVDAISLLAGGRADASAVREGCAEAVVEGRFVRGDDEVVVRRVVVAHGRSRAYLDGRMATVAEIAEVVARHVDLYAQHAQHSLLSVAGQRAALDRFAETDLEPLRGARSKRDRLRGDLRTLGGDPATREREAELLRFQIAELDAAAIADASEDDRLAEEQSMLGSVLEDRRRVAAALESLAGDGGALDCIGSALSSLQDAVVFRDDAERIGGLLAELDDATSGLRRQAETIAEDPERLEAVVERRRLIADLRRRHGDGTVAGLLAEHTRLAERLAALEAADATSATLAVELDLAQDDVDRAAAIVAATRREAAPRLAAAVAAELHDLAMPAARFEIAVEGEPPGDAVEMRFTANPGTTPAALAKVASGGELARAMLALRLVAASDQETVVFDEVDAGIGGTAAIAVGRALARLGRRRQVLVVTHLAQVAAAADHQVGVVKTVEGDTTSTTASMLTGDDRVVELSRMLSGSPESESGRMHARELLVGSEACR